MIHYAKSSDDGKLVTNSVLWDPRTRWTENCAKERLVCHANELGVNSLYRIVTKKKWTVSTFYKKRNEDIVTHLELVRKDILDVLL
jgi:hypothetical protein